MRKEWKEAIIKEGFTIKEVISTKRHNKLVVAKNNVSFQITAPSSPGDWRGIKNFVSFLRRRYRAEMGETDSPKEEDLALAEKDLEQVRDILKRISKKEKLLSISNSSGLNFFVNESGVTRADSRISTKLGRYMLTENLVTTAAISDKGHHYYMLTEEGARKVKVLEEKATPPQPAPVVEPPMVHSKPEPKGGYTDREERILLAMSVLPTSTIEEALVRGLIELSEEANKRIQDGQEKLEKVSAALSNLGILN